MSSFAEMATGKVVPPNGGWGWMVVIGAAMINVSSFVVYSFELIPNPCF